MMPGVEANGEQKQRDRTEQGEGGKEGRIYLEGWKERKVATVKESDLLHALSFFCSSSEGVWQQGQK